MTTSKLIFGREPAVWLSFIMAAVALISAFGFSLTTDQQGLIQAFVNAVLGCIVALMVRPVSVAALTAVVQTGVPLLVAFGLHLSVEQQGVILAFVPVALNLILRPQVTPKNAEHAA